MKLSQAKKYLPFVQAAAEGKTIQIKGGDYYHQWVDIDESFIDLFKFSDYDQKYEYRIKPEPKLRPWKPEEVPVGALYRYNGGLPSLIIDVSSIKFTIGTLGDIHLEDIEGKEYSTDNGKTWKPCGVEE